MPNLQGKGHVNCHLSNDTCFTDNCTNCTHGYESRTFTTDVDYHKRLLLTSLILCHFNLNRWQVKQLAFFMTNDCLMCQVLCTLRASCEGLYFSVMGLSHHFQCVPFLPTFVFTTFSAQASCFWLFEPITAWWFATVLAVFCYLVF